MFIFLMVYVSGVFAAVWGLLAPIVISQGLVCALDDGASGITSQDVVAPLLFLLGFFFIISLIISCSYITNFQVSVVEKSFLYEFYQ